MNRDSNHTISKRKFKRFMKIINKIDLDSIIENYQKLYSESPEYSEKRLDLHHKLFVLVRISELHEYNYFFMNVSTFKDACELLDINFEEV